MTAVIAPCPSCAAASRLQRDLALAALLLAELQQDEFLPTATEFNRPEDHARAVTQALQRRLAHRAAARRIAARVGSIVAVTCWQSVNTEAP